MLELITGNKGKGKTKILLDRVNTAIKEANGSIVYIDKSTKHMYELNNKIRLINVTDYMIENTDQFLGFVGGIISQDHDLEQMYFDSFLNTAHIEGNDISGPISRLQAMSSKFGIDFYISISMDKDELPAELKECVTAAL